jgi:hypothetical protein
MPDTVIETQARSAQRLKLAADAEVRRLAVARARHAVLPREFVPANDVTPETA